MNSLPNWAPESLGALYRARLDEGKNMRDDALLRRLLFDPRMEKVWKSINKRAAQQDEFPMSLFIVLSIALSYPEPKESPITIKFKYRDIAAIAKSLILEMEGTILDREGMSKAVVEIEKSAAEIASKVDFSFLHYTNVMDRFDVESPVKTMLTRVIFKLFMQHLKQPLWNSIATLVEVVLEIESDKVTVNFVRATCEGVYCG